MNIHRAVQNNLLSDSDNVSTSVISRVKPDSSFHGIRGQGWANSLLSYSYWASVFQLTGYTTSANIRIHFFGRMVVSKTNILLVLSDFKC